MRKRTMFLAVLVMLLAAMPIAALAAGKTAGFNRSTLAVIRRATARYRRLAVAEKDGFVPLLDCIEHPTDPTIGAMGVHYILPDRLGDDKLDLTKPEVLVYEVKANGKARLAAVEYVIPAALWTGDKPPSFFGHELTYKTTMGKYPMDPYYEVHVWAWRHNPSGMLADWNPKVTCPPAN